MAWDTSPGTRRELPKDWPGRSKRVLTRDGYYCQWGSLEDDRALFGMCQRRAREADHIGDNEDHSLQNLRALCTPHHAKRSARQGAKASGDARTARVAARLRTPDRHPGLLSPEELEAKAALARQASADPPVRP